MERAFTRENKEPQAKNPKGSGEKLVDDVVCNKFVTRFTLVKVVRREKISEKTNRKRNHTYV